MNQKNNIFEELNKMRNLIHTKPGVVISEQATQQTEEQKIASQINTSIQFGGTNEGTLIKAIQSIKSAQQFWKVNEILKTIGIRKDFVTLINGELEGDNGREVEQIIAHLKTIGITASADLIRKYQGKQLKVPMFTKNTFKITSQPTTTASTTSTVTATDDNWKTTYKCVLTQPGVVAVKLKNGATAYKLNNIVYYNNGRKRLADNKTIANYNCQTEFKVDAGGQTIAKPLNNTKNYANVVADYSKKLQTSLGAQPTGQLSDNDLQNILSSL